MGVRTKRALDPATDDDGTRILVDRYWPRGLQREQPRIDAWVRELAPSPALTAWFGHKQERWEEFKLRYWQELETSPDREALELLRAHAGSGSLTLVFGSRDRRYNNAQALAEYLGAPVLLPTDATPPAGSVVRLRLGDEVPRWRRLSLPSIEWLWLLFALLAPVISLLTAALLFQFGPFAWLLFMAALGLFCLATLVRVLLRERKSATAREQWPAEDRQPVWVGALYLLTSVAGVALGILALVTILLVLLNGPGHLHAFN